MSAAASVSSTMSVGAEVTIPTTVTSVWNWGTQDWQFCRSPFTPSRTVEPTWSPDEASGAGRQRDLRRRAACREPALEHDEPVQSGRRGRRCCCRGRPGGSRRPNPLGDRTSVSQPPRSPSTRPRSRSRATPGSLASRARRLRVVARGLRSEQPREHDEVGRVGGREEALNEEAVRRAPAIEAIAAPPSSAITRATASVGAERGGAASW